MIELASELLSNNIKFIENKVTILEVNNRALYNKLIYRLNRKINIDEDFEDISLYEGEKEISLSKNCMIIYDFFNIFSSQTKILKSLYEDVSKEFKNIYDEKEILSMQKSLIKSIDSILIEYDYELKHKEVLEVKDLLKALDLKFDSEYYDNPIENLYLLIDLISKFKICKLLILVNLKCYLKDEELEEVYKMIVYKRINVLFIEYYKGEVNKKYENKILIDEEFDEFYIN